MKRLVLIAATSLVAIMAYGHKTAHGQFELRPFGDTTAALNADSYWQSSIIIGVALRVEWSSFESKVNQFDWTHMDAAQSLAAQNNKKWSVVIGCGQYAPGWVFDKNTNGVGVDVHAFQVDSGTSSQFHIPAPWDSNYQSILGNMIAAIAQRYDNDPNFAYVVMSGAGYMDGCALCQNSADDDELNSFGGVSVWIDAFQQIAAMYVANFRQTNIVVNFFSPTYPDPQANQGDAVTAVDNFLSSGAPARWGIKWNNLTGGIGSQDEIPLGIINSIGGTHFTGFQLEHSAPSYFDAAYSLYQSTPAQVLEVYGSDIEYEEDNGG